MYNDISKYYDLIFPLKDATLSFLKKNVKKGKILDLGCATGLYSKELSNDNSLEVFGIDIDSNMINIAINNDLNHIINYKVDNMLNLKEEDKYDTIYTIGNSLVHLNDINEIKKVVSLIYNSLKENSKFILQIVNYDRILDNNIKELPTIKNNNISFKREYNYINNKIEFITTLETGKDSYKDKVLLLPIRSNKLIDILKEIGFINILTYGNYEMSNYDENNSFHLIITCEK